jgi:hypothetical protein
LPIIHFQALPGNFLATSGALASPIVQNEPRHFDVGNGNNFGIPGNVTYDYVVIGGGAAGNVIALRLAEDPNNRVAVVEA